MKTPMTIRLLALAAISLLAACSPAGEGTADSNLQLLGARTIEAGAPCYPALPAGASLDLPCHLRSEQIYKSKKGAKRRKVVLEILEGDISTSVERIEQTMLRGGYTATDKIARKKDRFVIPFKKKGHPTIELTFNPKVGSKPSSPKARFLITATWQLEPAPKKNPGN